MKFLILIVVVAFYNSCAPVKFARSNNISIDPNVSPSSATIICNPKINNSVDSFTYSSGGALPGITSNCNQQELSVQWIVKKADGSDVSATIPGLDNVVNPQNIDFQGLGSGGYYVFLEARSPSGSSTPFVATSPLEFIVPGGGMGNNLVCDPKLNGTFTSVLVNENDPNPEVRGNCNPQAAIYYWKVIKTSTNTEVQPPGLSTESQTPDFKSLGEGEYKITLKATYPNSGMWQSSSPLTVKVVGAPPNAPKIDCTPRINGSLTQLTLTLMSPKPLISANCNPADVTYSWSVTRGGANINNSGINGANSNPDLVAIGNGTYIIKLTATKNGMTSWSSTKPLEITVDAQGSGLAIQCAPRLNGQSVAMTILTTGPNPTVTANCQPAGVSYEWTVTRGGQTVNVSALSGATSTPQFAQTGLGTYLIYLTAKLNGYNTYVSPSPLEVTVAPVVGPTRKVTYAKNVEVTDNKVDILLVVDDSNSMLSDNMRLATRMNDFVTDLSKVPIDWQVCITITRAKERQGYYYWGSSLAWDGLTVDPLLLKPTTPNANEKFVQTIQKIGAGLAGSDDERGIKAAWHHVSYSNYLDPATGQYFDYNKCNRPDASLSVILISDEDERSIGGNQAFAHYIPSDLNKPLEEEDLPQSYVNKVKQTLGAAKRFTFNSIIVKPNDVACLNAQDADGDAKAHYGYTYQELSKATGGNVGSICDADYTSNLNLFKDRIVKSLASVPLECAPVGLININIIPAMANVQATLEGNTLVFSPAIEAERRLELEYHCPMN